MFVNPGSLVTISLLSLSLSLFSLSLFPPSLSREDMYAQDSIDMLHDAGIHFKRHEEDGIHVFDFAELLISSGLVLNENVTWIAFARYIILSSISPLYHPLVQYIIH